MNPEIDLENAEELDRVLFPTPSEDHADSKYEDADEEIPRDPFDMDDLCSRLEQTVEKQLAYDEEEWDDPNLISLNQAVEVLKTYPRPEFLNNGSPNTWTIGYQPLDDEKGYVYGIHHECAIRRTLGPISLHLPDGTRDVKYAVKRFIRSIITLFLSRDGVSENQPWLFDGQFFPKTWKMAERKMAENVGILLKELGVTKELCTIPDLTILEFLELQDQLKCSSQELLSKFVLRKLLESGSDLLYRERDRKKQQKAAVDAILAALTGRKAERANDGDETKNGYQEAMEVSMEDAIEDAIEDAKDHTIKSDKLIANGQYEHIDREPSNDRETQIADDGNSEQDDAESVQSDVAPEETSSNHAPGISNQGAGGSDDSQATIDAIGGRSTPESSTDMRNAVCMKCKKSPSETEVTFASCPRCQIEYYCSAKCRKAHRGSHKKKCDRIVARKENEAASDSDDALRDLSAEDYYNCMAHRSPQVLALAKELRINLPRMEIMPPEEGALPPTDRGYSPIKNILQILVITGKDTPENLTNLLGPYWMDEPTSLTFNVPHRQYMRIRLEILVGASAGSIAARDYEDFRKHFGWTPRRPNKQEKQTVDEIRKKQIRLHAMMLARYGRPAQLEAGHVQEIFGRVCEWGPEKMSQIIVAVETMDQGMGIRR